MEPRGFYLYVRRSGTQQTAGWDNGKGWGDTQIPTCLLRPDGQHSRNSARPMMKINVVVRLGWSIRAKPPTSRSAMTASRWSIIQVGKEHHRRDQKAQRFHTDLPSFSLVPQGLIIQTQRCWGGEGNKGERKEGRTGEGKRGSISQMLTIFM